MTNTLVSFLARLIAVAIILGAFGYAAWLIYVVTQMWGCCGGHLFG